MGIQYVYLAIGSVINNLSQIFTLIAAYYMIGESVSIRQINLICLAFIGVIIMSLKSLGTTEGDKGLMLLFGMLMMIASELFGSVSYVAIKLLGPQYS